jgi:hypothetical protein
LGRTGRPWTTLSSDATIAHVVSTKSEAKPPSIVDDKAEKPAGALRTFASGSFHAAPNKCKRLFRISLGDANVQKRRAKTRRRTLWKNASCNFCYREIVSAYPFTHGDAIVQ